MYEQDYIMRLIKEMVRTILKLLFNIDSETVSINLIEDKSRREPAEKLLNLIEEGRINEAENMLYELIEDRSMNSLMTGLIFYSTLNEKTDEYLITNGFSRQEVEAGLKNLAAEFGVENFTDIFE